MRARRDFRHNPAELGMERGLPMHDRGEDFRGAIRANAQHCSGGIVAAALKSQEGQRLCHRGHALREGCKAGNTE